ncbi:50S rRNA methyltransferase [Planctomycetota bacterium]|nr:50S rRNA methyltransferase [Planctomycetota bacterium]
MIAPGRCQSHRALAEEGDNLHQPATMDPSRPPLPAPRSLLGLTIDELGAWAAARGLPAFRGRQLGEAIWRQGATSAAQIKGWPKNLAAGLDGEGPLLPAVEDRRQEAGDGTIKTLLKLHDGKLVECVSIPTATRHTVCVSSQVGCPVGCTFCASGLNGVERDLTAGEIAYQVLHHHRVRPVTNVVFMGSGEPLFNYANLIQAIRVLADPDGLGLGRRRFTVSTSGVATRIRQLAVDEPQVTLALSIHAADDETRSRIVPLNRRWPLAELMAAMDDYSTLVNRRMTLEYVLLADANMTTGHAHDLAKLALRYGAHINLIPFNPVIDTPHRRPTTNEVKGFAAAVASFGGHATVRGQRGADIDAACGQLRRRAEATAKAPVH